MKEAEEIFKYIVEEIHSIIMATVDEKNRPITCAIDIMDYDESGLYFLTSRGKGFYKRLKENNNVALSAMKGNSTLGRVSINIRGNVKELGPEKIGYLFSKNEYMKKIYPTEKSKMNLTA